MNGSLSRRDFLKLSGGAAAGATVAVTGIGTAVAATPADVGRATLPYKHQVIAKAASLQINHPTPFLFPDTSSPCVIIKMGAPVAGGVGPDLDIVAYSTLCTHMGCPVSYDANARTFKCPCHFSMFDPEKTGQMICGQATENLPRIVLDYNGKNGTVVAVGVEGLIYGRQSNML
ncbi:MAG TPA: arsenate reductase (azurin) small subunit [Sulfuriferula sp.]|nr:arsenate reductase (azurin) small subunit [Sulfuriferula sp.]